MTLNRDSRRQRPPQTRLGKVVMWIIFAIAAVLAVVAIVIWIRSGVALF